MKCGLINSLPGIYFKANASDNANMKNEALNFGVVAPPNQLPNASLYDTVYSQNAQSSKNLVQAGGKKTLTAGKLSAGLGFGAMILSVVSLLLTVAKKH